MKDRLFVNTVYILIVVLAFLSLTMSSGIQGAVSFLQLALLVRIVELLENKYG